MAQQNISTPAGFGGLMRYKEEYPSKFKLSPKHVIMFIILVIAVAVGLRVFLPVSG